MPFDTSAVDHALTSRTAAALSAQIRAEQIAVFRRLLWRRLAVLAAVWLLLGAVRVVPLVGVAVGVGLFAAMMIAAGLADWRARTRLRGLTRNER